MKKDKAFDCVEMKNEIQRKLQAERQGLTGEELIQRIRKDIEESDSPIAKWWLDAGKKHSKEKAVAG